jgi:hypothetical protein
MRWWLLRYVVRCDVVVRGVSPVVRKKAGESNGTMEACMRVMLLRVDSSLIWHASMHVWVHGAL